MASLDGIRTHLGENDPRWKPSGGKRSGPASALPCITRARYRIFKRFIASRAVLWQIIPASEKAAWHGARAACSRSREGGSLREQVHFHPMLPYFHRGLHTRARIRMRGTLQTAHFQTREFDESALYEATLREFRHHQTFTTTVCGMLKELIGDHNRIDGVKFQCLRAPLTRIKKEKLSDTVKIRKHNLRT